MRLRDAFQAKDGLPAEFLPNEVYHHRREDEAFGDDIAQFPHYFENRPRNEEDEDEGSDYDYEQHRFRGQSAPFSKRISVISGREDEHLFSISNISVVVQALDKLNRVFLSPRLVFHRASFERRFDNTRFLVY